MGTANGGGMVVPLTLGKGPDAHCSVGSGTTVGVRIATLVLPGGMGGFVLCTEPPWTKGTYPERCEMGLIEANEATNKSTK